MPREPIPLSPDRDRSDFDLVQRLLLSKPRRPSLLLRIFRFLCARGH